MKKKLLLFLAACLIAMPVITACTPGESEATTKAASDSSVTLEPGNSDIESGDTTTPEEATTSRSTYLIPDEKDPSK